MKKKEKYGDQMIYTKVGEIEASMTLREFYINTMISNQTDNMDNAKAITIIAERCVAFVDTLLEEMEK